MRITFKNKILSALETIATKVNRILTVMVMIFTAAMACIVITNVFSRYVFNLPLTWSAELSRYCMIWSAFLGAAILVNNKQHLAVDILEKALKKHAGKSLSILIDGGSMVFFVVIIYYGFTLVKATSGQVASSMRFLPMSLVYLVVPVSAIFMLFGCVVSLLRSLANSDL